MSWACLGLVLACLGSVLGLSWACLGLSSVYLGLSWAFLGLSWPALACLGPVLSCGAPVFKHFSTLCCPELLQHVFGALFFLRARFLSLYPAVLEPTRFYTHDAWIAAGNSCWFSLADCRSSPAARRYVRSTSAASRRDAERAKFKVQGPNLASKAFLSQKSLTLKAYLGARLEIEAKFAFPPSYNPSPQGRTDRENRRKIAGKKKLKLFFSIFCPSNLHSKICIEKITKKMRKSRILASQNPSKTLPKSSQNPCSKRHTFFQTFVTIFF